jgi:hypothetical protein
MSPQGQHIELGIAESNQFLQLAALGLAGSLFGTAVADRHPTTLYQRGSMELCLLPGCPLYPVATSGITPRSKAARTNRSASR